MAIFTLVLSIHTDAASLHTGHISHANYHKKVVVNKRVAQKSQSRHAHHSSGHRKNNNRGHRAHSKNSGTHKITSSLSPASNTIAWNITGQENQYRTHPYSQFKGEISSPPPKFA